MTLTFANQSSIPHNLTLREPVNVATSTVVQPGTSETIAFTAADPGQVTFVCTLHTGMEGTIIVE